MNFRKSLRILNYFNFINFYRYNKIDKLIFSKYYQKKRRILQNSNLSKLFLKRFFKKPSNIEKFRTTFFNKNIFAYSNNVGRENIVNYLNKTHPNTVKKYIEYADSIIRREFVIFEKKFKFNKQINWNYSFFDDYLWPFKKSDDIDIRPKSKIIDVKYVWEFNRLQFLEYLGFGYFITKDDKYAIEFKNLILDWIKNNPPLYGINWSNGLEISIRLTSWIFTLYFFKDSKIINENEFFRIIFTSMYQHAYFLKFFHIKRSFNHTIGELFGVYLFCRIFNEIKPFKKWEEKFFKKFKAQISLQTRSDGVNIEHSVNYHRFVLEYFSLFLLLNPQDLKVEKGIIEKMYEFLFYLIKPNGFFPKIGDQDDGKILLLNHFQKNPFKSLLNLGLILFKREDFKFLFNKISISSLLLTGMEGLEIFEFLPSKKPIENIKIFEASGYYLLKNGWDNKANYLFIDYGRFGPLNSPHSHSNITNFIFSHKGKDIIIDSGTYTYNKSWIERNFFRSSIAHNVLTIDQKNQAKIINWFYWENKPKIKRKSVVADDKISLECLHNGYPGFLVKRKIISNKNVDNIIIKDFVFRTQDTAAENLYKIDINFHFAKDVDIKIDNNKVLINNVLSIKIASDNDFNINIHKTMYSPNYGFKFQNYMLNIHLEYSFVENKSITVSTEIKSLT